MQIEGILLIFFVTGETQPSGKKCVYQVIMKAKSKTHEKGIVPEFFHNFSPGIS